MKVRLGVMACTAKGGLHKGGEVNLSLVVHLCQQAPMYCYAELSPTSARPPKRARAKLDALDRIQIACDKYGMERKGQTKERESRAPIQNEKYKNVMIEGRRH
jgi:hypothetical protein